MFCFPYYPDLSVKIHPLPDELTGPHYPSLTVIYSKEIVFAHTEAVDRYPLL